jgi:pilus assembly protein CpaB
VTLLVSPTDAERIALAQVEGQIVLALRNPLDTEPTTTPGVRSANIFSDAPPEAPPVVRVSRPRKAPETVVAEAAPVQKAYVVEAIRAAKRTEEEVVR